MEEKGKETEKNCLNNNETPNSLHTYSVFWSVLLLCYKQEKK